jgi:DNA modification methylase
MDAIFGHYNFQSEIIWRRTSAHSARRWGPIHDTILMYSKSEHYKWNQVYQEHNPDYIRRFYRHSDEHGVYRLGDLTGAGVSNGDSGQARRGINPSDAGRHWAVPNKGLPSHFVPPPGYEDMSVQERLDILAGAGLIHWPTRTGRRRPTPSFKRYLDTTNGVAIQDIIWDIAPAYGSERMGYATQKPLALLERIIAASTDPQDVVLDPFCGCATTIEAAHKLDRKWVGIDIAIHAIKRVASVRLSERLGLLEGQDFTVEGVPRTVEGAQDLWERDPYHFQKWAVEQSDGFVTTKRAADGGVDGRLYFAVPHAQELQSMVIEVKGGRNVSIADVRSLAGVLEHDPALMAGLIVLHPPAERQARNFARFMAEAGTLEILGIEYPRLQLLTVEEILDGKRFNTPTVAGRHVPQPRFPGIPR